MVASRNLVHGANKKAGESADDIDATNKSVDATIEGVGATKQDDEWTDERAL
jgi:hypothetical protein